MKVLAPLALASGTAACNPSPRQPTEPQATVKIEPATVVAIKHPSPPPRARDPWQLDAWEDDTGADERPAPRSQARPSQRYDQNAINSAFRNEIIAFMKRRGTWGATECFRVLSPYDDFATPAKNENCPPNGFHAYSVGEEPPRYRINGDSSVPIIESGARAELPVNVTHFITAGHEITHHIDVLTGRLERYTEEEKEVSATIMAIGLHYRDAPESARRMHTLYAETSASFMKVLGRYDLDGAFASNRRLSIEEVYARTASLMDTLYPHRDFGPSALPPRVSQGPQLKRS